MSLTVDTLVLFIHCVEIVNISLIIAVFYTWKVLPENFKWIALYCVQIAPFILAKYTVGIYFETNNRFLFHLELLFEFVLLSMFFYSTLTNNPLKKTILIFALTFFVFTGVDYTFFESFWLDTPDNLSLIFNTWMLVLSLSLYYQIYTEGKTKYLFNLPLFWVVTALFFYNSTSIVINATTNLWSYNAELAKYMYFIGSILWLIYVLLLLNFYRLIYKNRNELKNKEGF